jgi:hypothetical protein
MDEKLNTELNWEYKDLEMILDLMRLRCDSTQWIVNRFVQLLLLTVIFLSRFDAHAMLLDCFPELRLGVTAKAIAHF